MSTKFILGYDSLSQLTSANISNIGPDSWTGDYNYQKNGDMDARTINSGTPDSFSYVGNEMRTIDGNSLNYDLNGNLTSDESRATSYEWNWDSKLRSASIGPDSISLKYDPAGNRVYKQSTVSGQTINRKYIVDIVGELPVILLEINPSNGAIAKTYIYANSQILAQHDGDYTASRYFYLHDRLGSVRQLINQNGVVVAMYTYSPFGETLEESSSEPPATSNCFMFTGQYYDKETGQYYLRNRQYIPYIARLASRDILMGDFNEPLTLHRYLYCGNDPVNWIDPSGLDKYIGLDKLWGVIPSTHMYVAVDVWSEEGRKIGQMRYEFGPKAGKWWQQYLLALVLTFGEINNQEPFSYDETHKALRIEQSRDADRMMKAMLDEQMKNPPGYCPLYNCWTWAIGVYVTDFDNLLNGHSIINDIEEMETLWGY